MQRFLALQLRVRGVEFFVKQCKLKSTVCCFYICLFLIKECDKGGFVLWTSLWLVGIRFSCKLPSVDLVLLFLPLQLLLSRIVEFLDMHCKFKSAVCCFHIIYLSLMIYIFFTCDMPIFYFFKLMQRFLALQLKISRVVEFFGIQCQLKSSVCCFSVGLNVFFTRDKSVQCGNYV